MSEGVPGRFILRRKRRNIPRRVDIQHVANCFFQFLLYFVGRRIVHRDNVTRRRAMIQPSLLQYRWPEFNGSMLLPKIYQVDDPAEIRSFIQEHSFATIVSNLHAAHIPLLFDHAGHRFLGHLTSTNPVLEAMRSSRKALVIFQGPHGYISSSSYIDQTIPPTWNFTAVHALGHASILETDDEKLQILRDTVELYEKANGTKWTFKSDDPDTLDLLPYITGFQIQIESLQCCYKLSQNRSKEDFNSAVQHLEAKSDENSRLLARWMRTRAGKTKR